MLTCTAGREREGENNKAGTATDTGQRSIQAGQRPCVRGTYVGVVWEDVGV